jgi:hypothetical protein
MTVPGKIATPRFSRRIGFKQPHVRIHRPGVQRIMTETRVVLGLGPTAALLWRHHRSHSVALRCATCVGPRDFRSIDDQAGFCDDCLDRSRAFDENDLGGES